MVPVNNLEWKEKLLKWDKLFSVEPFTKCGEIHMQLLCHSFSPCLLLTKSAIFIASQ